MSLHICIINDSHLRGIVSSYPIELTNVKCILETSYPIINNYNTRIYWRFTRHVTPLSLTKEELVRLKIMLVLDRLSLIGKL